jgi:hypothetical protein
VIPLYGFLQGDTIGILVLSDARDTMAVLAEKLQQAADVRVRKRPGLVVVFAGRAVDPKMTVQGAGMTALDRFDLREGPP